METIEELQARIAKIEADKLAEQERERNEKLGLITVYENEAIGYRNQAAKAVDSDKRKLYSFANDAEKMANELKQELGIEPTNNAQYEPNLLEQTKQVTYRLINSLIVKAVAALLLHFATHFIWGLLDVGIVAYVLHTLDNVLLLMSVAFGGSWLVCSILMAYFSDYVMSDLIEDFRGLTPFQKLAILAGLAFALLNFFSKFSTDGI